MTVVVIKLFVALGCGNVALGLCGFMWLPKAGAIPIKSTRRSLGLPKLKS